MAANRLSEYFREHPDDRSLPKYPNGQCNDPQCGCHTDGQPEDRLTPFDYSVDVRKPYRPGWEFGTGELCGLGLILLAAVVVSGLLVHEAGYDKGFAKARKLYSAPKIARER